MLRLVFSSKSISNRIARDFLENKKNKKISNFKKFIFKNRIYIPGSGLIFISYSHSQKDIRKIIKILKAGSIQYLR